MKKYVIFDLGGVIVDLDTEACKSAFRDGLGYTHADTIIDPCHQKGIIGDLEEGLLDADEFRRLVLEESRPDAVAEDVDKAFWKILVGIASYKAELIRKMALKYNLYILSNNNPICLPYSAKMFAEAGIPLDETFRQCFISYQMKTIKPSEKFYKAVIEMIGAPAEELLFIDDSQANVDAAIAAGLPAVHYKPGTDLSALLAEVLEDPSLNMEAVN
jgi:putative hydrolase of the HAD superfamily